MGTNDLIVKSVKSQRHMESPGHEAYLDVYAVDSKNVEYDIEVQRARYYSAIMDTNSLSKRRNYSEMNKTVVIFITEHDVLGGKKDLYRIERYVDGTQLFNDGSLILYVNGENQNTTTALGRLMHDFMCTDTEEIYSSEIKEHTKLLKQNATEMNEMKSPWEEMKEEVTRIATQRVSETVAVKMLKAGKLAFDEIAAYLNVPVSEIQKLAHNLNENRL